MAASPVLPHLVLLAVLHVVCDAVLRLVRLCDQLCTVLLHVLHVSRRLRLLPHQLRLDDGRECAGDRQRLLRGVGHERARHAGGHDAGSHDRGANRDRHPLTRTPTRPTAASAPGSFGPAR